MASRHPLEGGDSLPLESTSLLALLSDVFLLSQAILMREAGRLNYHQRPSFLMDLGPELPQKASSRKLRRVGVEAVLGS